MAEAPNAIAALRPSEAKAVSAGAESVGALLDVLTDEYSRKIVSSTVLLGRTVEEICSERVIPVSTCYRKVRRLVDLGLLVAEGRGKGGRKRNLAYRSAFSRVRVEMRDGEVFVHLTANPGVPEGVNPRAQATPLGRDPVPTLLSEP